jgi:hypothetical protein
MMQSPGTNINYTGTGVRINCISAGQIDVGVDLKGVCEFPFMISLADIFVVQVDMRGMTDQFPPSNLQTKEVILGDLVWDCASLTIG